MMNSYDMEESGNMLTILNVLGHEGLGFVQTLTDDEKKGARQAQGYSRC